MVMATQQRSLRSGGDRDLIKKWIKAAYPLSFQQFDRKTAETVQLKKKTHAKQRERIPTSKAKLNMNMFKMSLSALIITDNRITQNN